MSVNKCSTCKNCEQYVLDYYYDWLSPPIPGRTEYECKIGLRYDCYKNEWKYYESK